MIKRRRSGAQVAGRLLQTACVLGLPLVLAGCFSGYSLQDRISALPAGERDAPRREHDAPRLERRPRPQVRTRGDNIRSGEVDTVAGRIARWRAVPADHKRTPYVNSPEWRKEQAEAAEKDRVLDRTIRGICRGC
jgi:hypothetical protein